MNYIKSLGEFSYVTNRIFPHLDAQAKARRVEWTKSFWLFWLSAKATKTRIQMVLVHMDEKWFYASVRRTKNKQILSIGCELRHNTTHHLSHMHKVLIIAATGYIVKDNDIEAGGNAIRLCFDRAGRMIQAKKDSYKRVYYDDGSYSYPRIPENKLRSKGEYYWNDMDITGSSEGTDQDPKYSLLNWHRDQLIPAMEATEEELSLRLNKKIVFRYQMDGAGPHKDKQLLQFIESEFDQRGWLMKFQPSQSPMLNVKDAAILPMLSKKVSAIQGISNQSALLEGEQLFEAARQAWESMDLCKVARTYVTHHQIVLQIHKYEGGNEFLSKNRYHFGIRHHFLPTEDGTGIFRHEVPEDGDEEADNENRQMLSRLNVSNFDVDEYLDEKEIEMLEENMLLCETENEVNEAWTEYYNNYPYDDDTD